jgi:hypothetical protein
MNNNKVIISAIVLMGLLAMAVAIVQIAEAKPKSNIFTDIGKSADAGKSAGIAAFKAGLPDICNGDIVYCHEFHAGYHEAQDVAP